MLDHGFAARFPAPPEHPDGGGRADVKLRYEDVTQDGRIALTTLPSGLGEAVWRAALSSHPARHALRNEGIIPILSRFAIDATPGPFGVEAPIEARGAFQFAHSVDAAGAVDRIHLNMWLDLAGRRGRVWDPQPDGAGERIAAGRVFAEHVLTRLFAPPESRKVRQVEALGANGVPVTRYAPRSVDEVLAIPAGAVPHDEAPGIDSVETVFGLMHTDSNQHVNSLVYPRLFEEAAVRRLHARGVRVPLLARALEISFRKPCFAGDRVRVALRTYERGGSYGAAGMIVGSDDATRDPTFSTARPHAYVWVRLER